MKALVSDSVPRMNFPKLIYLYITVLYFCVTEIVQTCCHVFQHLQQHVLCFINELSALHYQFPQAQVAVENRADQSTFEMSLDGLHLHKRRQQSCGTPNT